MRQPVRFGVRIVDDPSPAGDGLPPMDVPVFVGFAARGPVHRPVAIEGSEGFAAAFGGVLDLVQGGVSVDPAERLVAHLQPAVEAFFGNGGRRCFVIRVAGKGACSAQFGMAGLTLWVRQAGVWKDGGLDLQLKASSPGTWADRLETASRLRSEALRDGASLLRGDLLRARRGSVTAWKRVASESPLAPALAAGDWIWPDGGAAAITTTDWLIERVRLDLAVRDHDQATQLREACGLASGAANQPWWEADADARFDAGLDPVPWPLAGFSAEPGSDWALLPAGIGIDFGPWRAARPNRLSSLERNGLDRFEAGLFLDPDWTGRLHGSALLDWADQVRFFTPKPRHLQGLHGALGRDDACAKEASWIAVTDAVHPGWRLDAPQPAQDLHCQAMPDPVCDCPPGTFDDCAPPPPVRPQPPTWFSVPATDAPPVVLPADTDLLLRLLPHAATPGVTLEVQRAARPDFSDAAELIRAAPAASISLRLVAGAWWLRARAHRAGLVSAWSEPLALDVRAVAWRALASPDASVLATVNAALMDLCAASREHFALLAAPLSAAAPELAAQVQALRDDAAASDRGSGTVATASFAALHHPWLLQADSDARLRPHPPQGALLGQFARRSRTRGAWSAPGADALAGAVALRGAGAELDGLNALQLRDGAVVSVQGQTLSLDADWQALGVRRLFNLLRRLCRREGERFVFEPNDGALRRGLERSFDALLHRLMQRGAFRGGDAASSYLIRTAAGADAAREIERGECSVLIQVAPSRPMRFLTLHLRRSGEQLLIEER